jgi:hypothetical protein
MTIAAIKPLNIFSGDILLKSPVMALDCNGGAYDIRSLARGLQPRARSTKLNA